MEKFISQFTAIEIENRLKDVTSKAGYFYHDTTNNKYLVFTDENTKDIYLDTQNPNLIIGELAISEKEPETYAEIYLQVPMYNVIAFNSENNRLSFTFDVKNKQGNSTGEEVIVKYNITNGNYNTEITETKFFGQQAVLSLDKYLREGTNTVSINITSKISKATTSVSVVYNAISITLADHLDISKVYDLSNGKKDYLEISYDVSGSHTKIMEWYLDGTKLEVNRSDDEILETVPISRTKTIELSNLSHGRHNIQFRVGTKVNGQTFYSDTLYRDFFVYTGINDDHIMLGVAVTLPSSYGVISSENSLTIPNMVQYISYDLQVASYSPINIAKTEVSIVLDQETVATISSSNNKVTTVPIVPTSNGSKTLSLVATEVELESQITYDIPVNIATTNMNLTEITSGLKLDFTAGGRNNNSTNRAEWSQGDITGTLTGFKWNNTSGWVNNRLEIDNGSELYIEYAPLANHDNGKTIEIEWMSKNVSNENAVLCDLTNDEGTGILITASSVIVTSEGKEQLEEKYKSNENVRVGIVINPSNRGTNKGLTFIYTNGVVSRSANVVGGDNYISDKKIVFRGTSEASISLKSIKVFDAALTSDQMLNNYNLYRDTVSEMYEVYDRNDIYEGNQISPTKMASRLPVMIVTGDIPTLENTNDKDTQIVVDIEYINMQDTSRSFIMKNAAMRPQGTSSMGYPKKNFRIYTRKIEDTILEVDGKIVKDKLYSFKKGAIPVDCWCLKADYAESSGTHNTGIAKLWGEAFKNAKVTCYLGENNPHNVNEATVLRTKAQQCAIDNNYPYDVRTTIDGFPILMFYRRTANDDVIFIGKYNFNNDKSTELVFGFEDIPGYDNSRTQCWESLNNTNSIGLFKDITNFYKNIISDGKTKKGWELAFEARYPDKSTKTEDLYAFASWLNGINGDHTRFAQEKWDHMDVYKMAGYYCYWNRHAAADQLVKNSMLTSEDGEHFFFILYDNDTINGLINTGVIAILPTDNRESTHADGSYKFAGPDSVLWNMLEADEEFMVVVRAVDNALTKSYITYNNVINTFDNEQSNKWVERVYNLDAEYKYITPYTQNGTNNLSMLQGKRELHRRWWLSNRFSLYDSLFVSGAYKSGYVQIKCVEQTPAGQQFKVTSGYPIYYGYGINNAIMERTETPLEPSQSYVFTTGSLAIGDPIAIYGAPHIKELDLSTMSDVIAEITLTGVYNNDLGTKLEKLIIGSPRKTNVRLQEVSGIKKATALKYLDMTNLSGLTSINLSDNFYLQELYAAGTNISSMVLAEGAPINHLVLPATFKNIDFKSLPALNFDGIVHNFNIVESIKISDCPNLSNDFNWVYDWYTNKSVSNEEAILHMDNIMWEEVDPDQLAELASIGDLQLKGKVKISRGSDAIINQMRELFGDTVFNKNAEFYIQAPDGVFLTGPTKLLEGESARYVAAVFSDETGKVQFSLTTSRQGCSIDKTSGVLTTTESGLATSDIVVRAVFITDSGQVISATQTVTIEQRSYPTAIEIVGETLINSDSATFNLITTPAEITGFYTVNWTLGTESAEYLEIASFDNTSCTLRRIKEGILETSITATVVKNVDGSTVKTTTKNISLVMEGVVITKTTNAPLQECLYKNGLVAHEDYSEKWELALITAGQLQPGTHQSSSIFYPYRTKLITFHEFQYFTGVSSTGSHTFVDCLNLTSITLPESLESIGNYAFNGCSKLTSITFSESVTSIGRNAFQGCTSLPSINIPNNITSIGDYAFHYCTSLTGSINIPENASIGNSSFSQCYSIASITLGGQNALGSYTFETCKSLKTFTIKDNIPTVGSACFSNCTGTLIIEKGDLPAHSLSYSKFDKLLLGSGVDTISYDVPITIKEVHVSSLEHWFSITISKSNYNPLYNGAKLYINGELVTSLVIPDSITELKPYSLTGSSFEIISVSENNPKYDSRDNCNAIIETASNTLIYGSVGTTIPSSVTAIGAYAFYKQSMQSITLPGGVTSIGQSAFEGCTGELIVNCNIPSATSSTLAAFYGSAFTKVIIGEGVTTIGKLAFYRCTSLTEINIPDGLTSIENAAFQYCSSLTSITLPDGLTTFGTSIFYGCSKLTEINIPEGVTIIDTSTFSECTSLTSITIPKSVTKIGDQSFYACRGLTSINISEDSQLTSIGSSAFNGCSGLTSITLPESLTSIGYSAFSGCGSLTSITIPDGLTSIGGGVFSGCTGIKSITSKRSAAPSVSSNTFGNSTNYYTGRNTYNTGENILYVPQGATGYDTGYWLDPLQNAEKCGFTISYTL